MDIDAGDRLLERAQGRDFAAVTLTSPIADPPRQIAILPTSPSDTPACPGYRRLRYIRYADDHLLGLAGTKAEAEEIKTELAVFLRDELKLTLSTEKTVITHARTHKARFLGYDIWTRQDDTKRT